MLRVSGSTAANSRPLSLILRTLALSGRQGGLWQQQVRVTLEACPLEGIVRSVVSAQKTTVISFLPDYKRTNHNEPAA